jgi:hypothetical protein
MPSRRRAVASIQEELYGSNSSDVIAAIKNSFDRWYQHQELWQQESLDLE